MFFLNKSFTTVDIGSAAIKAARIKESKDGIEVQNVAHTTLPENTIDKGEIQDSSILSSELDYLFNQMNHQPKRIVTSVPNQNLVIRNVNLPGVMLDELDDALKWEAEDYLPFPAEEAVMDYIVLEEKEDAIDIILVATQSRILHSYKEIFKRLGLEISVVNTQPLALMSLLESKNSDFNTSGIIEIGASSTRIIIGDTKGVYLFRTLDIGGSSFTSIIQESRSLNYQEAENYKKQNGIQNALDEAAASKEENDEELDFLQLSGGGTEGQMLVSEADDLAYEISRSLEFFDRNHPDKEIEQFYVCGGGSLLKGLMSFLEQETELQFNLIDPFKGTQAPRVGQIDSIQFSVAVGLGYSEVLAN